MLGQVIHVLRQGSGEGTRTLTWEKPSTQNTVAIMRFQLHQHTVAKSDPISFLTRTEDEGCDGGGHTLELSSKLENKTRLRVVKLSRTGNATYLQLRNAADVFSCSRLMLSVLYSQ